MTRTLSHSYPHAIEIPPIHGGRFGPVFSDTSVSDPSCYSDIPEGARTGDAAILGASGFARRLIDRPNAKFFYGFGRKARAGILAYKASFL